MVSWWSVNPSAGGERPLLLPVLRADGNDQRRIEKGDEYRSICHGGAGDPFLQICFPFGLQLRGDGDFGDCPSGPIGAVGIPVSVSRCSRFGAVGRAFDQRVHRSH